MKNKVIGIFCAWALMSGCAWATDEGPVEKESLYSSNTGFIHLAATPREFVDKYKRQKRQYQEQSSSRYQASHSQKRQHAQPRRVQAKSKPKPRPKHNFSQTREATGNRVFIFDPKRVSWGAYDEDGTLIKTGAASGGRGYCPDVKRHCSTPTGTFQVYSKGSADCKSSKYPVGKGGAPMPYCMFFRGGYAIHGSPHVPAYNASHGCIRVVPTDAQWLSKNFMQNGTTVIVRPYN